MDLFYQIGRSNLTPNKNGEFEIVKTNNLRKGYTAGPWEPFFVTADAIWWRRLPVAK